MLRGKLGLALFGVLLLSLCSRIHAEWVPDYIVATRLLEGNVTSLALSRDEKTLFALTRVDGQLKKGDQRYGLHILDVTELKQPKQVGYMPVIGGGQLYLSRDERTAFFLASYFHGQPKENRYGLQIVDVADRAAPKVVSVYELDTVILHMTHDRRTALLAPRRKGSVHVVDVTDRSNPKKLAELPQTPSFARATYQVITTDDDKYVITVDSNGQIWEFDFSDRSNPALGWDIKSKGYAQIISANTPNLYIHKMDVLELYERRGDKFVFNESLSLPIGLSTIRHEHATNLLAGLGRNRDRITVFEFEDRSQLRLRGEFLTSNYVSSIAFSHDGRYLYAGVLRGIDVIDTTVKQQVSMNKLRSAHQAALALYREPAEAGRKWRNQREAIRILEKAGVKTIVEKRPHDFTKAFYAHVLNDYAFFLLERNKAADSIPILRQVIEADPKRGVAYLNLGDALRRQLHELTTYDAKHKRSEEIVGLYKKYQALTGKMTERARDFLAYNLTNTQSANACEYVIEYANRGRLWEITTYIGHLDNNAEFSSGGTMHMPSVVVRGVSLGGRAENIDAVPYSTGNYVLHQWGNRHLVALTVLWAGREDDVCRFRYGNKQSIKKGHELPLCQAIQRGDELEYASFDKGHSIPRGVVGSAGQGAALIDIDNDGRIEPIVTLDYSSGAGRGCGRKHLAVLTPDRAAFAKSDPITKDLNKIQFQSSCLGTAFRPLVLDNDTYIEGKTDLWDIYLPYHKVFQIKNGEVQEICDFEFKPINEFSGLGS